jgi:hypothetical protein
MRPWVHRWNSPPNRTDAGTSRKGGGYQNRGLECGFVNGAKGEVADVLGLAECKLPLLPM